MIDRRDFLKRAALVGGALSTGMAPGLLDHPMPHAAPRGRDPLRILILGGTGLIGPHLVHRALARGHHVTIFNRGRSEPGLYADEFEQVEWLVGDRDGDLGALEGHRWDAVIDNSGYTPDQVRATARLLADSAGHYLFTSTRAVYTDFTHPVMDEDAPIGLPIPEEEWSGYGPLKALAEGEVQDAFPGANAILRPPIITGPLDGTDRFTYWYHRVDQGGRVLAPGDPSDPLQYLDVRDLVDFFVHLAEEGTTGIFNVEAPAAPLTSAEFLHGVRAITSSPVHFEWVDWETLEAHGLRGGAEIPGWRAPTGDWLNYGRMDNSRAIAAGMTFRPLAVTAADTLEWWYGTGADRPRVGIPPEVEAEVLQVAGAY
jgi:2'-hydroxyisoflavone reductase